MMWRGWRGYSSGLCVIPPARWDVNRGSVGAGRAEISCLPRSKIMHTGISPRRGKWKRDAVCGHMSAPEGRLDPLSEARDARRLIGRCLAGDGEAAREFQEQYGELIYGYPIRVYRVPADEAGDFYVFAFERSE